VFQYNACIGSSKSG